MVGNQVQNSPTLERRVPRRSFEGLLLELSPEGSLPPALAAELAAAGLDPSNLRDDYPLATWQDVLSAVHRHRLNAILTAADHRHPGGESAEAIEHRHHAIPWTVNETGTNHGPRQA